MPRLTPRLEAAKQQLVNEQVLALLSVMPARMDVTDAEIEQILAEAELQTDRLPGDEEPHIEPTRRQKLHSERALRFQVQVYKLYNDGMSVRKIARALERQPSSVQRALEAARALAGDRYEVTAASKNVVFDGIVKCAQCQQGQFCKKHDNLLGLVIGVTSHQPWKTTGSKDAAPGSALQTHLALNAQYN